MEKSIKDYLPKKSEIVLVQARIEKELVDKIKPFMEKNDLSWSELVEASIKKILDEIHPRK